MALEGHFAIPPEWHWQDTNLFFIPCQNGIGMTLTCLSSLARMALAGHSHLCHPVPEWHWWDTHLFVIPCQNGTGGTFTCLSSLARIALQDPLLSDSRVRMTWQDTRLLYLTSILAGHSPVCHPMPGWHWQNTQLFVILC
jgi:hypothetical protein